MGSWQYLPLLFTAVGVLLAVHGVQLVRGARRFRRDAARATGLVTEMRAELVGSSGNRSTVYCPVVRFPTEDGRQVEVEVPQGVNWKAASEGDPVTVLYDPANPRDARIEGFVGGMGGVSGTIVACLGVFFVVFSLLMFAFMRSFAQLPG